MERFIYRGEKTKEISFPLGGIGTGCIGISGNGMLIDWEIFNRPDKGSVNNFSHFAIKAESDGKILDARVLNGDLQPSYMGKYCKSYYQGYGFGPNRSTMAGVPHFKEVEFCGQYPFAGLKFSDENFPGRIEMTAFNPFIPTNEKDSSIPGAFFEITVENTLAKNIDYSLALSAGNPVKAGSSIFEHMALDKIHLVKLGSNLQDKDSAEYGDISIGTDAENVSYQEYWYRGKWFDNLSIFWRDFISPGKLKNRSYAIEKDMAKPHPAGWDMSTIATHFTLAPGEKKKIRFVITWNFPNCINYWNPEKCDCGDCGCSSTKPKIWKNYYATIFEDSTASALYSLNNWGRLYSDTRTFKDALFSSTLPDYVLDAISANMSILKTPTSLRLTDGSFYGFEGCHCDAGCCEGSCTHVWNYAYALPFLFPKLERSMRDLDYRYNMREDGGMGFRLQLPLGRQMSGFRPCADGQFGGIVKAYRDWKISGDTQWLKSNWDAIKKSIEYAWAETNADHWDADKDGVLEGRQHHTLDMELFGPNSWLTGFYLAALKAGAEMAEFLGETDTAAQYRTLFEKGKKWSDQNLFNGEYYFQKVKLNDRSQLEQFENGVSLTNEDVFKSYWNDEAGEIKYQIGEGCEIDQVLAQWHANLSGLGEVFDRNQVVTALKSIYKYNFKESMRNHFNPCRLYSINDESGVVICEWPEGKYKPVVPAPYSEETWPGCEYQVAAHMIQEGLVAQGLEIVKAVRDRFDGEKRNPWNEFECGSNYARSMSSYALLSALSGFEFDMVNNTIGFSPANMKNDNFRCFWSLDCGWGTVSMKPGVVEISVLYGELNLKKVKIPYFNESNVSSVTVSGKSEPCTSSNGIIELDTCIRISANDSILITYKYL